MSKKVKFALISLAMTGSAVVVRAEGTDIGATLGTAATTAITSVETIIGGVLVAAFTIVVGFFIFKKAKTAINKA